MTNLSSLTPTQLATLYVLMVKAGAHLDAFTEVEKAGYANCGQDFLDYICEAWDSMDSK